MENATSQPVPLHPAEEPPVASAPRPAAHRITKSVRMMHTARTTRTKPFGWYDRIFQADFTVEDLLLYVFTLVLIVLFWQTFGSLRQSEEAAITDLGDRILDAWQPIPWSEYPGWENGALDLQFLNAQVAMRAMLYKQGSISTAAISTRKNLGFLVGTIITILGSNAIVRGVRGSVKLDLEAKDRGKVTIETSLPGMVMVLVGGAIIIAIVLTAGERPQLTTGGAACPLCGVGVVTNGAETVLGRGPMTTTITSEATPIVTPSHEAFPTVGTQTVAPTP